MLTDGRTDRQKDMFFLYYIDIDVSDFARARVTFFVISRKIVTLPKKIIIELGLKYDKKDNWKRKISKEYFN